MRSTLLSFATAVSVLFALWVSSVSGKTLYVAKSGDGSDGQSWETAYKTISGAITSSATGDVLWVKGDVYYERIYLQNRDIYGGFSGEELPSDFDRRDWNLCPTVIVGASTDGGVPPVVLNGKCVFDGINVTDHNNLPGIECATADLVIANCRVENCSGGIQARNCEMTLLNSTICDNQGYTRSPSAGLSRLGWGGGLFFALSRVMITGCTVSNNISSPIPALIGRGGAIFVDRSNVEIYDSRIEGNAAAEAVGLFILPVVYYAGRGSGIDAWDSRLIMERCIVRNNGLLDSQSFVRGVGLSAEQSSVVMDRVLISGNDGGIAVDAHGNSEGGGVYLEDSTSEFRSCLIGYNSAVAGAGAAIRGGTASFTNCIFAGNATRASSTIVCGWSDRIAATSAIFEFCTVAGNHSYDIAMSPIHLEEGAGGTIRSSIVWKNDTGHASVGGEGSLNASYSIIEGTGIGSGNLNADPLFVNPTIDNYRLQAGSPCIDSATASGPATDLDGNPRPFDVPGVGADGQGAFDMGAYEFTLLPTPYPTFVNERSDIDGSDLVDAKDLLILLSDWKKTTGQ